MFEPDQNMKTNQNMKIQSTMYAVKMIKKVIHDSSRNE